VRATDDGRLEGGRRSSVCLFSEVPESGSGPLRHVNSKREGYIVPTASTAIHPTRHGG
jgi:hypothetical protein